MIETTNERVSNLLKLSIKKLSQMTFLSEVFEIRRSNKYVGIVQTNSSWTTQL